MSEFFKNPDSSWDPVQPVDVTDANIDVTISTDPVSVDLTLGDTVGILGTNGTTIAGSGNPFDVQLSRAYTQHCENILLETTLSFLGASSSGLPSMASMTASGVMGCYVQIASGTGGIRIRQDGNACTATTGLKFLNETSVTPTIIKLMSYNMPAGTPLTNVQIYATDALLNIVYFKL